MSRFDKDIAITFKERPVGFKVMLENAIREQLNDDTPRKTGKLRGNNRVRVKLDSVEMSNNTDYAKYVEKSGPRQGGVGTTRFFTRNANSRAVNSLARKVRDTLNKKMAARKKAKK